MKTIQRLIRKFEQRIRDEENPTVCIVAVALVDFVGNGYFKDEKELNMYMSWRVAQVKQGAVPTGPFYTHTLDCKDVDEHIEDFRAARDQNILPNDGGVDPNIITIPLRHEASAL